MAIDNGPTGMAYPIPDATELRHSSTIVRLICALYRTRIAVNATRKPRERTANLKITKWLKPLLKYVLWRDLIPMPLFAC